MPFFYKLFPGSIVDVSTIHNLLNPSEHELPRIQHICCSPFPLMWMMLPKKGNSHTDERKQLIGRYIRLFGADSIECLLADREFVGKHWFEWLIEKKIKFHLRIKENMWIDRPGKVKVRASWLLNNPQNPAHYPGIVQIDGNELYLSGIKTISKDGVAFVIVHDKRIKYLKISIINVKIFCYIVDY